jgi:mannose-1-phosphate guanylyltransferase
VKAFLLAAGHGPRLRPLTGRIPKWLVPIREVSMLEIWFEVGCRAGIDQILINLHAHFDSVRHALRQWSRGLRTQVAAEPVLLGSAGTLVANRDWVGNEPCFWVLCADALTSELDEDARFPPPGFASGYARFVSGKDSQLLWHREF